MKGSTRSTLLRMICNFSGMRSQALTLRKARGVGAGARVSPARPDPKARRDRPARTVRPDPKAPKVNKDRPASPARTVRTVEMASTVLTEEMARTALAAIRDRPDLWDRPVPLESPDPKARPAGMAWTGKPVVTVRPDFPVRMAVTEMTVGMEPPVFKALPDVTAKMAQMVETVLMALRAEMVGTALTANPAPVDQKATREIRATRAIPEATACPVCPASLCSGAERGNRTKPISATILSEIEVRLGSHSGLLSGINLT